jgi:hypothetical protein
LECWCGDGKQAGLFVVAEGEWLLEFYNKA